MPHTTKLSPAEKQALVEQILAGTLSRQAAARSCGVSNTTVRQWVRLYESEGPAGLEPRAKAHHLTAEEKQAAARAYLNGEGSLTEICRRYGIRGTQNLQKWAETLRQGGTLRGYCGASRHKGQNYTTAARREEIVRACLADGCDYGKTALTYDVSYKALVAWVQAYQGQGAAALRDGRHAASGRSHATGQAQPTPPLERLAMVLECLALEKDYGAVMQRYGVSYQQIYAWVRRYGTDGWAGLRARRGRPQEGPEAAQKAPEPRDDRQAETWVHAWPGVPEKLPELMLQAGFGWQEIYRAVRGLGQ